MAGPVKPRRAIRRKTTKTVSREIQAQIDDPKLKRFIDQVSKRHRL